MSRVQERSLLEPEHPVAHKSLLSSNVSDRSELRCPSVGTRLGRTWSDIVAAGVIHASTGYTLLALGPVPFAGRRFARPIS